MVLVGQSSYNFVKILLSHQGVEKHGGVYFEEIVEIFDDGRVEGKHEIVLCTLRLSNKAEGSSANLVHEIPDGVFFRPAKQQFLQSIIQRRFTSSLCSKNHAKSIIFLIALQLMQLILILFMGELKMRKIEIFMVFFMGQLEGVYLLSRLKGELRSVFASFGVLDHLRR